MRTGQGRPLLGALTLMSLTLTMTMGCTTLAEDPIYPFQHEVEKRLNGSAEQNRKYAILLPLQLGLTGVDADQTYRTRVLEEIGKREMKEALPFLEKGLEWDCNYWHPGQQAYAAELWLRFSTPDMEPERKADFLVESLKPGFRLRVQSATTKALAGMGEPGRAKLMDMLRTLKQTFTSENDVLIAAQLRQLLAYGKPMKPLQSEEADELSRSPSSYVRYVCVNVLAERSDKRAVELGLPLLSLPEMKAFSTRCTMVRSMPYCPGGEKVFAQLITDLMKERSSSLREYELRITLGYASAAQTGPFKNASQELRAAVKSVAEREDTKSAPSFSGEALNLFAQQCANREKARELLQLW